MPANVVIYVIDNIYMLHAFGLHALGLQTVVDALQAILQARLQESDSMALTVLRSGRVAPP